MMSGRRPLVPQGNDPPEEEEHAAVPKNTVPIRHRLRRFQVRFSTNCSTGAGAPFSLGLDISIYPSEAVRHNTKGHQLARPSQGSASISLTAA